MADNGAGVIPAQLQAGAGEDFRRRLPWLVQPLVRLLRRFGAPTTHLVFSNDILQDAPGRRRGESRKSTNWPHSWPARHFHIDLPGLQSRRGHLISKVQPPKYLVGFRVRLRGHRASQNVLTLFLQRVIPGRTSVGIGGAIGIGARGELIAIVTDIDVPLHSPLMQIGHAVYRLGFVLRLGQSGQQQRRKDPHASPSNYWARIR